MIQAHRRILSALVERNRNALMTALSDPCTVRIWHAEGMEQSRVGARVVDWLSNWTAAWEQARLEIVSELSDDLQCACQFRIWARVSGQVREFNGTTFLRRTGSNAKDLDIHFALPLRLPDRYGIRLPADVGESDLVEMLSH
jgi:hypothetical protein